MRQAGKGVADFNLGAPDFGTAGGEKLDLVDGKRHPVGAISGADSQQPFIARIDSFDFVRSQKATAGLFQVGEGYLTAPVLRCSSSFLLRPKQIIYRMPAKALAVDIDPTFSAQKLADLLVVDQFWQDIAFDKVVLAILKKNTH